MTNITALAKVANSDSQSERDFFVHPLALVESDDIGPGTRVWPFAHVMKGVRVGGGCNIGEHAFLECGVVVGNNVTVKNGVAIWTGVTIEDDVFLGPNCVLTNDPNPRAYIKKPSASLVHTRIRANATVGANATLLCGISIGRYAFIGAGAVVIRSVADFALVVGNPSRQIGWMCACGKKIPMPVSAAPGTACICAHCKRPFSRVEAGLSQDSQPGKEAK
jgi:UDP-2-acetamido-3-amino-2,3-dideoxy-glucuronate N-acetyltransferase